MSGIYIHIPFCKQACHYCDFHFSTSLKNKESFLNALKKEIAFRKDYLAPFSLGEGLGLPRTEGRGVRSLYFGGGTPSLLSKNEILEIFDQLNKNFSFDKNAEITLEANPDDLTKEKLRELKQTPVNRLSIGIQSFSDTDLQLLNRAHNSKESLESVKSAQDAGFENISIDLIYGIPTLSNEQWEKNLETAFGLNVPHISAYCLSIEPKTAFADFIRKGKIQKMDDEKAARQFEILMEEMEKHNFVQYEISNFSKVKTSHNPSSIRREKSKYTIQAVRMETPPPWGGWEGLHNSSYWKGAYYLGLGPSSHSYDGNSRQSNVANNNLYIRSIENGQPDIEREVLSENDKYNEYILTSLRTMWGCNLNTVKEKYGEKKYDLLIKNIQPYISQNFIDKNENILTLTNSGKFISDKIIRDLFV